MRILIANRGEIARRIIRTAGRLGHQTVAVFADPDAAAPFVNEATMATRIGPAALAESYLSGDALLAAAKHTAADAIHPGYGFLSENAEFARSVIDAGLVWIGPHPEAIGQMGSKIQARRLAVAAGVPIIPGFDESQDPDALAEAADRIGFPVLVKAAAGGGGKGIRIVREADEFHQALAAARTEAERSFGDGAMIVERYIQRPRHVEVQVIGDKHGHVLNLGTRECSVQRRYQKLLEEAPAPNLEDRTRQGLRDSATDLARSIHYDSAGTVEFVVDDETGDYFFLEMNTRLQVEHPVTELVTGFDVVELQLRSAAGEPLGITQNDVRITGHAFEARINAEDPAAGFTPQTGTISHLRVPPEVRWDSGIELGSEISPHYDPMVAKLIVAGPDRESARRRLAAALDELVLGGLTTNTGFHRWLIDQAPVVEGRVTTRFLDETDIPPPEGGGHVAELAARAWLAHKDAARASGPWGALGPFRTTPHQTPRMVMLETLAGEVHEVTVSGELPAAGPWVPDGKTADRAPASVDLDARSVAVTVGGTTHVFRVRPRSEHWAPAAAAGHGPTDAVVAPFPGIVTDVVVAPGATVAAGQPVVVIEAMKMLHTLAAAGAGVVEEIRVAPGDQVASHQALVTFSNA